MDSIVTKVIKANVTIIYEIKAISLTGFLQVQVNSITEELIPGATNYRNAVDVDSLYATINPFPSTECD